MLVVICEQLKSLILKLITFKGLVFIYLAILIPLATWNNVEINYKLILILVLIGMFRDLKAFLMNNVKIEIKINK